MHYGESIKAIGNEVKLLPRRCQCCMPNAEIHAVFMHAVLEFSGGSYHKDLARL